LKGLPSKQTPSCDEQTAATSCQRSDTGNVGKRYTEKTIQNNPQDERDRCQSRGRPSRFFCRQPLVNDRSEGAGSHRKDGRRPCKLVKPKLGKICFAAMKPRERMN